MTRFFPVALALLTSCNSGETPEERAQAARTADNGVECALAGAPEFERQCTLERGEGGVLTVHHPDGGFRRLALANGELSPLDGADLGQLTPLPDGRLEWAIDRDRYRLPAQQQ